MEEGGTFKEVASSYTWHFPSKEEHYSSRQLFLSILYSYSLILYIVQFMKGQEVKFFCESDCHFPFHYLFPFRKIEIHC